MLCSSQNHLRYYSYRQFVESIVCTSIPATRISSMDIVDYMYVPSIDSTVVLCVFLIGNKYTLDTHPRELGIDVREELLKFHSTHYSSNLMCLVVLGKGKTEIVHVYPICICGSVYNNLLALLIYYFCLRFYSLPLCRVIR